MCSEEFQNTFLSVYNQNKTEYYQADLIEVLHYLRLTHANEDNYKKYTEEELSELADEIITILDNNVKSSHLSYGRLDDLITILFNLVQKDIMKMLNILFKSGIVSKIHDLERLLTKLINELLTNEKIEEPEALVKFIQTYLPDYHNYPLIINNPNVSDEDKIKVIKLTYRQKDLPQYKSTLRENIGNLNNIDIFIEATIIQNNRVKEKEKNIISFFKDMFVSPDNSVDYSGLTNKKEFAEKYLPYFNKAGFVKNFYSASILSTNSYYRKKGYERFIKMLFNYADLDTQIDIISKGDVKELSCIISSFAGYFLDAASNKDGAKCEKILSAMYSWGKNDYDKLLNVFNKNQEALEKSINLYPKFINEFNKNYEILSYNREALTSCSDNYAEKFITTILNEDNLVDSKVLSKFNIEHLGFNYAEAKQREKKGFNTYNLPQIITEVMNNLLNHISDMVKKNKNNNEFKEKIIQKYFACFESSDVTDSLAEEILNFNNDPTYKQLNRWYGSSSLTSETALRLIDKLKSIAELVYDKSKQERLDALKSNLDDATDTIKLICNIN